jgi:AAHS family 4-hydroxybenzoate transporter-like MFS transporter
VPFTIGCLLGALIMWNFTQVGGQTGINNLATLRYPPEMRSSGIGWAGGGAGSRGIAVRGAGAAAAWSCAVDNHVGIACLPSRAAR